MKFPIRLMILGLGLVNGLTTSSADVFIDGQVIQEADISSISIDPISGDVTVDAGGLYTVTRDGDPPPPGPQVSVNLTVSPTTILEGESVVVSWSTSEADSCTPSGGTGGWDQETITLPSGSTDPITIASQGTYTFRLDCENATPDTDFDTASVQVNPDAPPPPGSSCPEDFTAPLIGETRSWFEVTQNIWPDPISLQREVTIGRQSYLAIEFNTGDYDGDGGFSTIEHTSTYGNRYGAISKCPGDFSEHLPDSTPVCTESFFIGGSVKWSTEAAPAFNECELEADTTYYLNLTFVSDGADPALDECQSSSTCRTILRTWR